ncbi:Dot/Icm type IV secretion system ATPase DotB [Coxiella burnetii]|uniref:Dot/Icm type IV secretion system ATPase DotB n=1 Tax=Coxiella burnetii TaxID=777 RepID=UPI0028FC0C9A|nr:Dot/Icm type IV secretion system ATPase DotB [Coxiella burnetii]
MIEKSQRYPNEPSRFEPKHIDDLLIYCHRLGASDITIQTGRAVLAEVYGRLQTLTRRELSNAETSDLLNAIYGPNGTTQIMRGEDIDTHYEIRPNRNERFRYRINGTGCHIDGHEGIQITIRAIPAEPPLLSKLDLPAAIVDAIAPQEGVVYVTGATGSGKSTLLAAIIRELAEAPDSHRKILTYEAPIEYVYDSLTTPTASVCQSEIPRHLNSFAAGVRNALRRKPHAILVGEARDNETISAVLEAALTGHPVYTTLHSSGVAETIRRLVGSFPAEERIGRTIDIIETLRLIIWQRLVPSVDGKRVALREFLVFKEEIRDLLLDSDPEQITAAVRRLVAEHGQPMQVDVEAKFKGGLISERLYKILSASQE